VYGHQILAKAAKNFSRRRLHDRFRDRGGKNLRLRLWLLSVSAL
jgi:hypothetical protein